MKLKLALPFSLIQKIKELDLSRLENKTYLQYKKEFTYKNEYSLLDGRKIVEDKNLYLEDLSGNNKISAC